MTARKPLWNQNGTTSAEEDRSFIRALFAGQGGTFSTTDLAVAQHGTPNMSVDVSAGRAAIPGTESAALQGTYLGWLDATLNVAIAASDATNARIDLIVARVKDQQYSGVSDTFTVEAVTGTPSGSPAVPATPANSIVLAQIAVAATVTTIVTGNITDKRTGAGARLPVVTSGGFFSPSPTGGQAVYLASQDVNEGLWLFDGAAFRRPWNMPWGEVAKTLFTAAQSNADASEHVVAAAATTFTAVANRAYRIRVSCTERNLAATAATITSVLKDGTTVIETRAWGGVPTVFDLPVDWACETTLSAGAHTINLTHKSSSASGVSNNQPAVNQYVTIDDIGPASGTPS